MNSFLVSSISKNSPGPRKNKYNNKALNVHPLFTLYCPYPHLDLVSPI